MSDAHDPPDFGGPDFGDPRMRAKVKAEIRRTMRALRGALPETARAARSRAIAGHVTELPEFERAKLVLAFVSTRGEVDPGPVVEAAWAEGRDVALPRVDLERETLTLHRHRSGDALVEGAFGIFEPDASSERVSEDDVDFVLVPALAVDPEGHRIGYGKGFYDRLLPTLPRAFACAVAFDFQLVAEVPAMAGDVPVDVVVTDARVLRPSRA